ncbi:MAG: DUF493 family protein [Gammaproteobacteria bacterium]|nr:DUF493 family protein [Gammaproteobacteria bacterium]
MTNPAKPGIEFPCNHPIKVIVDDGEIDVEEVFSIARRHDPELDRSRLASRSSRNGNDHFDYAASSGRPAKLSCSVSSRN